MECRTGVGRIVWGHPNKPQQKKDPKTKAPILKDGLPVMQCAFGVAFPKAEFERDIWPIMSAEATSGYPGGQVPQKFSWKYVDGDGVDGAGKRYSEREGYAGCYVLTVSTEAFVPSVFKFENGAYRQLNAEEIKCGDYVALALDFKVNIPADRTFTPSLFVNPKGIEHVAYGKEIAMVADPNQLFGGRTYQLPTGASATPLAPSHGAGMPGTGAAPGAPAGYAPPPGQMPPPAGAMPGYAPPPGQMPGHIPPPAPAGYAPPPAAPAPGYAPQPGQMPGMMPSR